MIQPSLFTQLLSLLGAGFCLVAYVGHQLRWMRADRIPYNLLNIMGSGVLGYIAFRPFQAGFLVMEGVWSLVSIYALVRILLKR